MRTRTKKLAVLAVPAAVLCGAAMLFAACDAGEQSDVQAEEQAYIISIEENEAGGYTITYSDGSTKDLSAVAGEDGKDGEDLTITQIWKEYIAETGVSLTLAEFIEQYLQISAESSSAIAESLLSCVSVRTEFVETSQQPGGGFFPGGMGGSGAQIAQSAGSGVIYAIDEDSVYIITNYHVVYDSAADEEKNGGKIARAIHCYLYGSEELPSLAGYDDENLEVYDYGEYAISCEYVGGSLGADIAVLRADKEDVMAVNENVRAVTVAEEYYVGESVYAIGNAEGEGISATEGIVSVDSEYITLDLDDDGTEESYRSIRFDATIYHGNSGGGLFNSRGELIGITNAGIDGYEAVCYAIPASIAKGAADNILYHAADGNDETQGVYKVTLGVAVSAENTKYSLNESGLGAVTEIVHVQSVTEGLLAEEAGIAQGDVLVALVINGERHELTRTYMIGDLILTMRQGDTLQFVYEREGEQATSSSVTLTQEMFEKAE